jgi:hypothetical protein
VLGISDSAPMGGRSGVLHGELRGTHFRDLAVGTIAPLEVQRKSELPPNGAGSCPLEGTEISARVLAWSPVSYTSERVSRPGVSVTVRSWCRLTRRSRPRPRSLQAVHRE